MFCRKCGKFLEGDASLCAACAAAEQPQTPPSQYTDPNASTQQPPYYGQGQEGQYAQPVQQAPVENPGYVFDLNSYEEPPKKKGKGKIAVIGAVAAVLVVGIVALVLNWSNLFGKKNYSTPQEQLAYVEQQALNEVTGTVSDLYGSLFANTDKTDAAAEIDMHLLLGEDLLSTLEMSLSQSGVDADLSWLADILLEVNTNVNNNWMDLDLGIGLGTTPVLSLEMIYDLENLNFWMGLPGLSNQYLYVDTAELSGMGDSYLEEVQAQAAMLTGLTEALPSDEAINQLLNKYIGLVLSGIKTVETSTETKEVDGLKQELTVLTATITDEDLLNIAISVLETAQNDADLKQVIDSFGDYYNAVYEIQMQSYNEYYGDTYEAVDLYSEFSTTVAEGLEALKAQLSECDPETNYLTLVDYVNGSDEIVGRSVAISTAPENVLSYLTVSEKGQWAFAANLAGVTVTGSGTDENGKLNGSYLLNLYDSELLELELVDIDTAKLDEGKLLGKLQLYPTAALIEDVMGMDSSVSAFVLGGGMALELSCEEELVSVNVISDNAVVLGLTMAAQEVASTAIEAPSGTALNAANATDEQMTAWLASWNVEQLVSNLKAAGVPAEYADLVGQYFQYITAY